MNKGQQLFEVVIFQIVNKYLNSMSCCKDETKLHIMANDYILIT